MFPQLQGEQDRYRLRRRRRTSRPTSGECRDADSAALANHSQRLDEEVSALSADIEKRAGERATALADFNRLDAGPSSAVAAADAEIARAEMAEQAEAYIRKRTEVALLRWSIAQYRLSKQAPLLVRASELFARLTRALQATARGLRW